MIEKGTVIGSRYEIIEKVGSGGMATVYKAKCNLLNRFVAVKVLKAEYNEDLEFVKKFRREAQSAASLSHPNIVSIYDVGKDGDTHYIVMEFINGKTLKEVIEEKGGIKNDDTLQYALQIASALEHAHENHIIHRDIKSHNIILREDHTIKVTDFGIARVATSNTMANTGSVLGSVHYFAPEQARGGFTDEKSDIYSLGIVLFEMVTGRLPFDGDTAVTVALKQIQEIPPMPSSLRPGISTALESIILKCLEKSPINRYQNASFLIDDLRTAVIIPNKILGRKIAAISEETIKIDLKEINQKIVAQEAPIDEEEYEEIKKVVVKSKKTVNNSKNKTNKKALVMPIALGVLCAVLLFGGSIFIKSIFNVKEEIVPNVVAMEEEAAMLALKELGFEMEVSERVKNAEVPKGQIIRQEPEEGITNKVTNPIKVIVSEGAEMTQVPDLMNQTKEQAIVILQSAKLEIGEVTSEFNTLPVDTIIWQSEMEGTEIAINSKIDIKVSGGSEKIFMPDYFGKSFEDVKKDMKEKGLVVGETVYVPSDNYEKDKVIKQSITASSEVARNSVVDFVISKGRDTTTEVEEPGKTKNIKITLPTGLKDVLVTVQQVQGNNSVEIYKKKHNSEDSPLNITAKGNGKYLFYVYIDTDLVETLEENF